MVTFDGQPLTYDANGNLISRQTAQGAITYTWDAQDRLIAISGPNGTASFKYDYQGRRIEKTVNGTTTAFLYDGPQAIAELQGSAIGATYLTGLQIDEVLARYANQGDRTLLSDALGSVIAQTDETHVSTSLYAYSPYGEVSQAGENDNPLQYTGRENDDTGLYYYRARYYDPALKRFITSDPIGLRGGLNMYAYVKDNPLLFVDPTGEIESSIGRLLAAICVSRQCESIRRGAGGGALSSIAALGNCISILNEYAQANPGEIATLQALGKSLGAIASECGDICSRLTSEPNFVPSCQNLGCLNDGQSGA